MLLFLLLFLPYTFAVKHGSIHSAYRASVGLFGGEEEPDIVGELAVIAGVDFLSAEERGVFQELSLDFNIRLSDVDVEIEGASECHVGIDDRVF
jgi:hypothetical protein